MNKTDVYIIILFSGYLIFEMISYVSNSVLSIDLILLYDFPPHVAL